MGGIIKKVSPVAMLASKGDNAPAPPKQVAGGGIETPIKGAPVTDEERKKKSATLLGQGGERKVGL